MERSAVTLKIIIYHLNPPTATLWQGSRPVDRWVCSDRMEETRLEGACGQILQAPQSGHLCKCSHIREELPQAWAGVCALTLPGTGVSGRPLLGC